MINIDHVSDRREFGRNVLLAGAAGYFGLLTTARAGVVIGYIVIDNNYGGNVRIHLYHSAALDRRFGTWPVGPSQRITLADRDGKAFSIGGDWGIQIEFGNGVQSAMQRVSNVGSVEDGVWVVKASAIYDTKIGYVKDFAIKNFKGYEIDETFGAAKTDFLKDSLAYFYVRFLQPHWRVLVELGTKAKVSLCDDFAVDDFQGVKDDREYMERQFIRMCSNDDFAYIKLKYVHDEDQSINGWLARAYCNQVRVFAFERAQNDGRYKGSFEIEINDYYLNNRTIDRSYANPEFWAGVIAHESLHQLGHKHPKSRSDPDYYQHQMILIEYMIMNNGNIRYGDINPTPCLCGGEPH